jgi:predicted transcriptional regulator
MKTTTIKTGSVAEFLEQGREIARLIDQGLPLPEISSITFEDIEELLELLKADNLTLFRAIKEQPDSIAGIAARLHRDNKSVRQDIDALEKLGMVKIKHLREGAEYVQLTAQKFRLEADIV